MTNKWYSNEELIRKYESLNTAHRNAVSKYIRMVADIQDCGVVMKAGDEVERAVRKHCGSVPQCAFFSDCAKAIREDNGTSETIRRPVTKVPRCSFCGKKVDSSDMFFGGNNDVIICGFCVSLCMELVEEKKKEAEHKQKVRQARAQKHRRRDFQMRSRTTNRRAKRNEKETD